MVGEVGQQYPEVMQAVHLYFTQVCNKSFDQLYVNYISTFYEMHI